MKKIIALSLLLAATLGGCNLYGSSYGGTKSTLPEAALNPTPASTAAAPSLAATVKVEIKKFSFNPFTVTVKRGDTVIWTNNDSAPHQIKAVAFSSNRMSQGQSFSFTFNQAGTYDYLCSLHPSMLGKIIVE